MVECFFSFNFFFCWLDSSPLIPPLHLLCPEGPSEGSSEGSSILLWIHEASPDDPHPQFWPLLLFLLGSYSSGCTVDPLFAALHLATLALDVNSQSSTSDVSVAPQLQPFPSLSTYLNTIGERMKIRVRGPSLTFIFFNFSQGLIPISEGLIQAICGIRLVFKQKVANSLCHHS